MTDVTIQRIADALRDANLLVTTRGPLPSAIFSLTDDSRAVTGGTLFVAVRGSERDGHDYLAIAERAGATAAIVDDPSRTSLPALVAGPAQEGWPLRLRSGRGCASP